MVDAQIVYAPRATRRDGSCCGRSDVNRRASSTVYGRTAIAEISTFKSRGERATSTVARAGGASLKNVA